MDTHKHLFCKKIGTKGPALLILHGLMGSSDNWQQVAKAFSSTYQVFVPDLRNHGRSFHAAPHSLAAMREDLLQLMGTEGLQEVNLIGHSMGGKVAMSLALGHPLRVRKLVVVDIAMRRYPAQENLKLLQGLRSVSLEGLESRRALDTAFAAVVPEEGLRHFLLKNLERNEENGFRWRPNIALLVKELAHYLGEVPVPALPFGAPTLWLRCGRSSYVQDSDLPQLQAAFSTLKVEVMKTGHWPHAEQPTTFVATIKAFLGQKI